MAVCQSLARLACPYHQKVPNMSLHLIIGDKLLSSWSLRGALALDLAGAPYTEELIKLNQPDTRERLLKHSPTGKVPLLKTEHGTIADSLAIAEYLAEQFPEANLWPADIAARAQARSACAQMHSGFFAMRGHMPFDLSHDAPLSPTPADVTGGHRAHARRCGPSAVLPLRNRAVSVRSHQPGRRIFCTRSPCACAPIR
jgi:glutathione S-transferase